jgi:glycosyltransferase involved in cell wall biosynthesis
VLGPIVTIARASRSRSLDDERAEPRRDPPLVSLVIPARDEARNIERCVASALASDYPRLEVIVVDDHSSDGTGDIVRAMAARDASSQHSDRQSSPTAGDFAGSRGASAGSQGGLSGSSVTGGSIGESRASREDDRSRSASARSGMRDDASPGEGASSGIRASSRSDELDGDVSRSGQSGRAGRSGMSGSPSSMPSSGSSRSARSSSIRTSSDRDVSGDEPSGDRGSRR